MGKREFIIIMFFTFCNMSYSQWVPVGPYGGSFLCIATSGQNVVTSTCYSGIYTSSNSGNNWILANNNFPALNTRLLLYSSNKLYAGTEKGIYQSTDNGNTWIQNSLYDKSINTILISNNYIYAGTMDSGIYVSSDNGISWLQKNSGLMNKNINALVACGSYIFAGTDRSVFVSGDNGNNWVLKEWGFCSSPMGIKSLASIGTYVYASSSWGCGVYRTTNYGNNWYSVNGLPNYTSIINSNENLYAYGSSLYISTNSGYNWINMDISQISGNISGISFSGQKMFVCTTKDYYNYFYGIGGVFYSTNSGVNWFSTYNGIYNLSLNAIANVGTNLFAGKYGMFITTNNGINWCEINTQEIKSIINVLYSTDNSIYAGTGSGIFVSSNNGQNWINIENNNFLSNVTSLAVSGSNIFAGQEYGDLYISSNNGTNWRVIDTANLHVHDIKDIIITGTNVFACFDMGGICRSTNNGLNWTAVNNGLPNPHYYCVSMAKDGQNVFACYYWGNGIYMSSNNGDNWIQISNNISNRNFSTIVAYNGKIFVGADSVIYYSSNYGTNWIQVNQGFPAYNSNSFIHKLYISNGYIYATTIYRSVWRRSLDEFLSIRKVSEDVPTNYYLFQNYPNPFNPKTIIRFKIKDSRFVTIKIYDILGQEIQTLVNQNLNAGTYEIPYEINTGLISSGIYFYKIKAGKFSDTKKMLIIK
jgi:photosystem II stability/assembly factor-like uncharacterized protein